MIQLQVLELVFRHTYEQMEPRREGQINGQTDVEVEIVIKIMKAIKGKIPMVLYLIKANIIEIGRNLP